MDKQHLTVNDIVLGDYVQEWSEIPGNWSMPMYVDGIFGEGDLYLNFDGNEADPWDANVKDVYDIPIDWGILSHFGFFEADKHLFVMEREDWMLSVYVFKACNTFRAYTVLQKRDMAVNLGEVNSIRALQHKFYDETKKPLKLTFE